MEAEYYPPREDVILQNEAPSDAYILVTGSVVSLERERGRESLCLLPNLHILILLLLAEIHCKDQRTGSSKIFNNNIQETLQCCASNHIIFPIDAYR